MGSCLYIAPGKSNVFSEQSHYGISWADSEVGKLTLLNLEENIERIIML